jgi:thiol:disulfide interchange protein DsbC
MKKSIVLLSGVALALSQAVYADDAAITHSLDRLGVHNADVQPSPVAGLKTALTENGVLYVSDDGRHVLQGPLYDVGGSQPVNVTNQLLSKRLNALQDDMIVYRAPNEKHVVTVFTDITCGYCHKLHEQLKDYNDRGITIRYLAFPRQGLKSRVGKDMASVWCSANPKETFDRTMQGEAVAVATCKTDISKQYRLGVQYGIQGTPALLLTNGVVIPGYQSPDEMVALLKQQMADGQAAVLEQPVSENSSGHTLRSAADNPSAYTGQSQTEGPSAQIDQSAAYNPSARTERTATTGNQAALMQQPATETTLALTEQHTVDDTADD